MHPKAPTRHDNKGAMRPITILSPRFKERVGVGGGVNNQRRDCHVILVAAVAIQLIDFHARCGFSAVLRFGPELATAQSRVWMVNETCSWMLNETFSTRAQRTGMQHSSTLSLVESAD